MVLADPVWGHLDAECRNQPKEGEAASGGRGPGAVAGDRAGGEPAAHVRVLHVRVQPGPLGKRVGH